MGIIKTEANMTEYNKLHYIEVEGKTWVRYGQIQFSERVFANIMTKAIEDYHKISKRR